MLGSIAWAETERKRGRVVFDYPPKDDEVYRQQWGLHRVCGPGASGSFPHATPWFGSEEVSASSRGMKCLGIVLLNYYVLNITMTKVPLDFSSFQ